MTKDAILYTQQNVSSRDDDDDGDKRKKKKQKKQPRSYKIASWVRSLKPIAHSYHE